MDAVSTMLGVGGLALNAYNTYATQKNNAESRALQKYFYEDSKAYNTPFNQVQRLRAAGLNPAFVYGQEAGNVAASSAPSQNPLPLLDMSGLASMSQAITQNDVQRQQIESETSRNNAVAKGQEIENAYKDEDIISTIYGRDSQSWLNDQMADIAKLDLAFNKESYVERLKALRLKNELADAEIVAADITNMYLPFKLPAEINELVSRQFANYAHGRASLRSAHAAIMQAVNNAHAFDAQYGADPDTRKQFFNASLDALIKLGGERASTAYKNYLTPAGRVGLSGVELPPPTGVKKAARVAKDK